MAARVDVQVRNLQLTELIRLHVEERASKLDHYLPVLEEVNVELSHHPSARNANDRNVAQITVRGKGLTLRAEERASEVLAAFDAAIDILRTQIDRFKGRHYHHRGDGLSATDAAEGPPPLDDTDRLSPLIVRRKQFRISPMNELEALEQMRLLGHDSFFLFFNAETNRINVLYRRRDGTYGLIEPEVD